MYKEFDDVSSKLFTESRFFRSSVNALPSSILIEKKPAIVLFKDGEHFVFDESQGNWTNQASKDLIRLQARTSRSGSIVSDGR